MAQELPCFLCASCSTGSLHGTEGKCSTLTAKTPYLLPFEFFPLTDQLDEQPRPLQVMPQFLPVLQLFLYCTRLLILLLLEDIAAGLEVKSLSRCPL